MHMLTSCMIVAMRMPPARSYAAGKLSAPAPRAVVAITRDTMYQDKGFGSEKSKIQTTQNKKKQCD